MSTLVEELEQAADEIERLRGAVGFLTCRNQVSDQLRARAAWVRRYLAEADARKRTEDMYDTAWRAALECLTGPIPATETAPSERKEP